MLLGMLYIVVELLTITPLLGLVQLIIATVWAIFWLAAGAATADALNSWGGFYCNLDGSNMDVACAFSWLCFLLSLALCGFAFLDMKAGKGISGRGSAPASAPAGTVPASTVEAKV